MNIVVAMKQIPDLQQVRIKDMKPVLDGVPPTFGDIDKSALETGVQLKEVAGGTLYVLSVGDEALEDTVKEALAAGADAATLLVDEAFAKLDSAQAAALIAEGIRTIDDAGIILFGESSGDNYSGQVASRVAEILGRPQIGYAKKVSLDGDTVTAVCSYEDHEETVTAVCPVVISVVSEINPPRIPAISQILKCGRKPKEVLEADDLKSPVPAASVETLSVLAPETNRKCEAVAGVKDLVEALNAERVL